METIVNFSFCNAQGGEMQLKEAIAELKPREKLLYNGPDALSDTELLAILLRTGVKGRSALALSGDIINHFGSLNGVFNGTFEEFEKIKGVGLAKFVQFKASLELSKRYLAETMKASTVLDSPDAVRKYLHQLLKNEPYEKFLLIHLDNQHMIQEVEVLFSGTIDSAAVYPRVVIDSVIKHKSSAVIFAHNHPSGNAEPSQADIQLTKRLKQVLAMIDVRTLDHFVVGYENVVSLAERGQI